MLWQIAGMTGYTINEIMWRVPWVVIRIGIADMPRYETDNGKKEKTEAKKATHDQFLAMAKAGIVPETINK